MDQAMLARLRHALALRSALVKALEPEAPGDGRGKVWYDRERLEPGDPWESDIVSALHGCEAAVLLLSPEALASPWVLREATVLADRRSRWPSLCLVPVLFGGATRETLAKHPWWAALSITRWQPVQAPKGAFEGQDAVADIEFIVGKVAQRLANAVPPPLDPPLQAWSERVNMFLTGVAQAQLNAASDALRMKRPKRWDADALRALVSALFQTDVADTDGPGMPLRYPLLQAMAELVPGDPSLHPRTVEQRQLCALVALLAAPPGAAVAVGAAWGAAEGGTHAPVLLRADELLVAELAARRASRDRMRRVPLTNVMGESGQLAPKHVETVAADVRRATRAGLPAYVIGKLPLAVGDDPGELAQQLRRQLPSEAALVAVIGRPPASDDTGASPAGAAAVVVTVPAEDEAAALVVEEDLRHLAGPA